MLPSIARSIGAVGIRRCALFARRAMSITPEHFIGDPAECEKVRQRVKQFAESEGRQPRILVAKMSKEKDFQQTMQVATGFADFGFDVDVGPYFHTPAEAAQQAVDADVHAVEASQVDGHLDVLPKIIEELKLLGRPDILVIACGHVNAEEHEQLHKQGVRAIFDPNTKITHFTTKTLDEIEKAKKLREESSETESAESHG
ncbi:hypothetical protein AB6A40_005840 [Gnathostoma spinigerum]|uniref:B12-binding domain-containing protein n=1 Tax=Gnathostoma spinigerum TaxID=75299 RepID=A0ABD6EHD3_9BILA